MRAKNLRRGGHLEKAYKLAFGEGHGGELYMTCCGCSRTEPLHHFGPALKPHYLIHYVLSGKGIFRLEGKEYPLEAGYGFLIGPGQMSFYQADEKEPWTYIWVGFAGSRAEEYAGGLGLSSRHPVFRSENSDELYGIVRDMMDHNTSGTANEWRRNGFLQIFLSVVAQSVPVSKQEDADKANQYVRRAVEFIRRNYCNPIRVTDVADYVCVNRSYLYTLFENSLGMSPQQFLATCRLTRAAELLKIPDLPVESIAFSCGYQDPLAFTRAFRQKNGLSPSAYRKQLKEDENRWNREHLKQVEDFIAKVGRLESGGEP